MLENIPDSVLLMHRGLFDRFESVVTELGIELGYHHYDGVLSTS